MIRIYYIIGEANNIVSDSAADMASLVLMDFDVKDELKYVQQHMDQLVDLVELDEKSVLCGISEVTADLHDLIGIDVIGIIRPDVGVLTDYKEIMKYKDLLIFRGPLENVNQFIELAKGNIDSVEEAREKIINDDSAQKKDKLKYHQD